MRILITGGLGYLGGRLAQHLGALMGIEVFIGSRRRTESPDWFISARMVQTQWDSLAQLTSICEGIDAVVHLAAMNAGEAANDPAGALQMNGVATTRLLEAAIKKDVSRFVYLSTAHVYGVPLEGTISETTKTFPLHPYATNHRAGEDAVLAARHLERIPGVVLRLSNGFGAPVHPEVDCWDLLIPDLCRQAVTSNRMVVHSTGLQRRDFIPMRDTCRAIEHILLLPSELLGEGLFNVGGEWSPTVWDVGCLIRQRCAGVLNRTPQLMRKELNPDEVPMPLTYSIERLKQTGFTLQSDANSEIDDLLRFCLAYFA